MRCLEWAVVAMLILHPEGARQAVADQWGHWRGPNGNGAATAAAPPIEFAAAKNLRWKVEIPGRGSSSPVVWDQSVFVTAAVPVAGVPGELDFRVLCFDRATGVGKWSRSAVRAIPHEGTHETNGFASHSPCTDGIHLYASFGSRGLFCYTMAGELVWSRDFGDMTMRHGFGEGSSPTLAGDLIIVPWDHEGPSRLYALDKKTGRTVWEVSRDEPSGWCTPLIAEDSSGRGQVIMNGENAARGYDLETGQELWRCGGQTVRPCASAVAANGVAYVASGFRGAFIGAFDLTGRGDLSGGRHVLWTHEEDTPDIASPLLSNGRLYYYKEKTGLLTCVDAQTGKPHYMTARIQGLGRTYASPVAANGHVYLTDRSGMIVVIEDAPALKIIATNDMGEGVDATPAAVGADLFIRGERHLFCVSQN